MVLNAHSPWNRGQDVVLIALVTDHCLYVLRAGVCMLRGSCCHFCIIIGKLEVFLFRDVDFFSIRRNE